MVEVTTTVTACLYPTEEQAAALHEYTSLYSQVCNHVSLQALDRRCSSYRELQTELYHEIRRVYELGAQATISAIKQAVAAYKTLHCGKPKERRWTKLIRFRSHSAKLVYGRDYSLFHRDGEFTVSVPSLHGRLKMAVRGLDALHDEGLKIGTATLKCRRGKWLLLVPITRDVELVEIDQVDNILGVDMGIRMLATAYDSKGNVTFHRGGEVKNTRARYALLRKDLQRLGTPSARRKLRATGSRESRWMSDVNHVVSKALVEQAGPHALIVLEDLTGIRNATERVRRRHRYLSVSWAFADLRSKIEYKATLAGARTIAVDPRYTSQMCPKCGHVERGNRNKRAHAFACKRCGYRSNDDRVAAINLQSKGIQYRLQCVSGMTEDVGLLSTSP